MRLFINGLLYTSLLLASMTVWAVDYETPDGIVSVELPPLFSALSNAELESWFTPSMGNSTLIAFGNSERSSAIYMSWEKNVKADDRLPELMEIFVKAAEEKIPQLTWIDKRIVSINGKQWVLLDSTAPIVGVQVRNRLYLGGINGNVISIGQVSRLLSDAEFDAAFANVIENLTIHPNPRDQDLSPIDAIYDPVDIEDLMYSFGWDEQEGYPRIMEAAWTRLFVPFIEAEIFNLPAFKDFLITKSLTATEAIEILWRDDNSLAMKNYVLAGFAAKHKQEVVPAMEAIIKANLTAEQIKAYLNLGEGAEAIRVVEGKVTALIRESMHPVIFSEIAMDYFVKMDWTN